MLCVFLYLYLMKKTFLILVICLLFSCTATRKHPYNDENYVFLKEKQNDDVNQIWLPNLDDLLLIDELLQKMINEKKTKLFQNETLKSIKKKYSRQYFYYIDKEGNKIVNVNGFCSDLPSTKDKNYWKNNKIIIFDGGCCVWIVQLNISANTYNKLVCNGEA